MALGGEYVWWWWGDWRVGGEGADSVAIAAEDM
jgi:hypothetical protein